MTGGAIPPGYLGADGAPAVRACPVCDLPLLNPTAVACLAHSAMPTATVTITVLGETPELAAALAMGLGQLAAAIGNAPNERPPGTFLHAHVQLPPTPEDPR